MGGHDPGRLARRRRMRREGSGRGPVGGGHDPVQRGRLPGRDLLGVRAFQDFLRPLGIDPDRDVDEVILGWRSEMAGPSGYMGLGSPDKWFVRGAER